MSFLSTLRHKAWRAAEQPWAEASKVDVERILLRGRLSPDDFFTLLSDATGTHLEAMAQQAAKLTRRHFGNSIILFTPLYVSNYCDNVCPYCSFAHQFSIERRHLTMDEIAREAEAIAASGIRHVLLLSGECRSLASIDYLLGAIRILRRYFSSIGIEVYPLTQDEYRIFIEEGVDSLTIYQETYDEARYHDLHKGGPKDDFAFRLEAAERACRSGIRAVTVGALLGLGDWRFDGWCVYLHAKFLLDTFHGVEVSVSLPRLRPLVADFPIVHPMSDRNFVQLLTALRIALPTVGITISTRESPEFRNNILPLGVTKMSAASSTAVGGRRSAASTTQFLTADTRSVEQVCADLLQRGFQPVMHDWSTHLLAQGVEMSQRQVVL